MKKVLFIRAIDTASEVESRYPGLGLAYLASSLRSHFGEDYFEFKIVERGSETEVKKIITEFNPDIVGISSVTQNFNLAKEYANFVKGKKIPIIMGGVHISMLPKSLPESVDLACVGEGEETIIEIFELFDKNNSLPKNQLKNIKGIAYRDINGSLELTSPRPLIKNLDSIKMPARDLIEIEKHSYIFSSRGCPYRCSFCASSRFWSTVRLFSAQYVVNEIRELYEKYGVKFISFYDDLFIISKDRLVEINSLLKKENLHNKIKFTCSCRSNLVNEEIAQLLEDMGVVAVGLGLESGSKRILNYLKGETTSVEHNKKAVDILKKHGISVNASFVIGSPDETEYEMMETYDFIKNNKLDLVDIYVLMPLPGTPVWEYALGKGFVSENMDWSKLNVNFEKNYKESVVVSEIYTRLQMYKFYKRFRRLRLYLNVKNIWHSPFLTDLPMYMVKMLYEKIISFTKVFRPRKV